MQHICKYCGKQFDKGISLGGHTTHCIKNPNRENTHKKQSTSALGKILSIEHRKKISNSRLKYLNEHPEMVPYKLNHSKDKSWPEKEFERILKEQNIKGWVYNYYFGLYAFDFAFPEWKLDIEIDGGTHLLEYVKEKDKKRDNFSKEHGWTILRFTASEIRKESYKCLQKILDIISKDKKIEIPKEILTKNILKLERQKKLQDNKILKQKLIIEKIEKQKQLILNSNIDFTKFGWVGKVANLLNISHTTAARWIKIYVPELKDKIYKRKLSVA